MMPLQNAAVVMLLLGELKHHHLQGYMRCYIMCLPDTARKLGRPVLCSLE